MSGLKEGRVWSTRSAFAFVMAVSTFDLFKIGIGTLSHTEGTMRAAARFVSQRRRAAEDWR